MRHGTGMALVLAAGTLWSFQGLMIRQIELSGPWAILFWRSLAMLPVVFAFLAWRTKGSPLRIIAQAGSAGLIGGLGLVLAMAGAVIAFQNTTVANAAFLFAASPLIAAVLGRIVLHERVAPHTLLAIALAMLGIFLMVRDGLAAGAWLGNVAGLLSSLGFAIFTVALRWRHIEDAMPVSLLGGCFALLVAVAMSGLSGQPLLVHAPDIGWATFMGAVTLAGGMILYSLGSKVVPAAELTLLSNIEGLLAPTWAWLLLGEIARPATFIGGGIVLAAIVFNGLAGHRQRSVMA
ncbi:MAG: DMT family transporter [Novosphingobium sp.]